MVKIIKDGKKTKIRKIQKYKAVCDNCGCELEFTEDDLKTGKYISTTKSISLTNLTAVSGTYEYVNCPCCNKEIKKTGREVVVDGWEESEVPIDTYPTKEYKDNFEAKEAEEQDPCSLCMWHNTIGDQCAWCQHNRFKPYTWWNNNVEYKTNLSDVDLTSSTINTKEFATESADLPDFGHVYVNLSDLKGNN